MTRSGLASGWRASLARLALTALVCVSVLLTDLVPQAGLSPASAQQRQRTIMDMLFGAPPRRRYIDDPRPRRIIRKAPSPQRGKQRAQRRSPETAAKAAAGATIAGAAVAAATVEKSETAKTVLVVGDFLAGSLAGGLEDAVAKNPGIRVVGFSNGSSGFVRDDHYDWLEGIGPLLDDRKPAVVVAMIGSNDRQPIRSGGESLSVLSAGWTSEYERRVEAFAKAVSERNVPLVWVGMPAFKFDRMSEDMAALNDIYRKVATSTAGGEFVDVWEGFVDPNGAFTYSGPDIAGQTARLRNSDGITMTPAGSEKLAFFAEKSILRLLGGPAEVGASVAGLPAGEVLGPAAPPAVNAANATSAPRIALTDPAFDGGDALLGGGPSGGDAPDPSPRDRLVVKGAPAPSTPGRADDFTWSAKTSAVVSRKPDDPVVFRGAIDLSKVREPEARVAPAPMPSLADAIVEEWAAQARSSSVPTLANPVEAPTPGALPAAALPLMPSAATPAPALAPAMSASPFAEDQGRR